MPQKHTLKSYAVSDKGKRKTENEDCILSRVLNMDNNCCGVFAVADGVGGTQCGKYASSLTIENLERWWMTTFSDFLKSNTPFEKIMEDLIVDVQLTNVKINEESIRLEKSMATTLSLLLVYDNRFGVIHIGDCRVYRIRKGKSEQLTEDDTWVESQIKSGKMTREEAQNHKKRHAITKCLGIELTCDLHTYSDVIKADDAFILCSDGFYEYFSEEDLVNLAKTENEDKPLAINEMIKSIYDRGAKDNISIITVNTISKRDGILWWKK